MKISGEASVAAAVPAVYAALTDPAVLVRTIPGCQRLEQTGPDIYQATVLAGVAAIKGAFAGEVRLSDRDEPHAFTLHASGAGSPGTVSAVARVSLAEAPDGTTRVAYDADATIGGVIGGVGQRMITGVARKTAAEFFAAVDRELTGKVPAAAVLDAALEEANLPAPPARATVWTAPGPDAATQLARQRVRDLMVGAAFGAVVALLGVLIGAIVAGW
jgi:carbon monoxide dehydrogenase subunit G